MSTTATKELYGLVTLTFGLLFVYIGFRYLARGWHEVMQETFVLLPTAMFVGPLLRYTYLVGKARGAEDLSSHCSPHATALCTESYESSAQGSVDVRGESFKLALAVQERYWHPDRFDPSNPDTVPRQKDIVDWIKAIKPGISDALAKSIEKVACPIER